MLSELVQFPKNKQYMKNLNELLDHYEQKNLQQTQQLRSARNTTNFENKQKGLYMQRFTFSDLTNPLRLNPLANSVKFVHSRSMSSIVRSSTYNSDRNIKTAQQIRKQKMISILSTQNVRKQLMSTRKMSAVHSQKKLQQNKIKQRKNNQYDLRLNVLKNHNKQQENQAKQRQNQQNIQTEYQLQLSKNQDQRNCKTIFSSNSKFLNDKKPDMTPKQGERKQYLKKGSSINKSILNTIIRLKLSRKISEANYDPQKQIQNDEIVKMIKVYKGVEVANTLPRSNTHNPSTKQNIKCEKDANHIQGWYNDTEQFDLNLSHHPSPPPPSTSCQI